MSKRKDRKRYSKGSRQDYTKGGRVGYAKGTPGKIDVFKNPQGVRNTLYEPTREELRGITSDPVDSFSSKDNSPQVLREEDNRNIKFDMNIPGTPGYNPDLPTKVPNAPGGPGFGGPGLDIETKPATQPTPAQTPSPTPSPAREKMEQALAGDTSFMPQIDTPILVKEGEQLEADKIDRKVSNELFIS